VPVHQKKEVSRSTLSEAIAQTGQTHRHTQTNATEPITTATFLAGKN